MKKNKILIIVVIIIVSVLGILFGGWKKDSKKNINEIIKDNEQKITEQITGIIGKAEDVRYALENCNLEIVSIKGNRADCLFWADWKRIREPKDDPFIQGLYQAAEALSDEKEKKYAIEIADGWLAEMQSWPENERLEHQIVIFVDDTESWLLYYNYVMDGQENLVLLDKYAEENMTENEDERYREGINIIDEAISSYRKQK